MGDKEISDYDRIRQMAVIVLALMSIASPYLSMVLTDYFDNNIMFDRHVIFSVSILSAIILWIVFFIMVLGLNLESEKSVKDVKE